MKTNFKEKDYLKKDKSMHWKTLKSQIQITSPWYKIKKDSVELPNGVIINDYYVGQLLDVSILFAITEKNEVVLVKQYRHGTKDIQLELPAGTFKRGKENPSSAAKRELLEETGFRANKLIKLGVIEEYPTKNSHLVHMFLAPKVKFTGKQHNDITEEIKTYLLPINEVITLAINNRIMVGSSITTILLAALSLGIIKN
ncbi:MAG: NUDIX hydrolase [Candidatus Levybacteria bacterium CG_4_10_14_0_2_um_filter_36_16]|nr:MAG: NUDIX hydrolase [Candidatus Levybacteria bacterium CG10_big_fil_rev_8_21_14_0_10_36_30]PIZ97716.1 MAG: NUDIX hydrolase [Candidatus Levybacteria bacterium CG_4_10_14_0_2_um_filter_36_16]PJA90822.1 MAG: NUDIX hydrolase [Candidatus Levybacteria bacterium CG_4_9_14_3_um_filter_36_7]